MTKKPPEGIAPEEKEGTPSLMKKEWITPEESVSKEASSKITDFIVRDEIVANDPESSSQT